MFHIRYKITLHNKCNRGRLNPFHPSCENTWPVHEKFDAFQEHWEPITDMLHHETTISSWGKFSASEDRSQNTWWNGASIQCLSRTRGWGAVLLEWQLHLTVSGRQGNLRSQPCSTWLETESQLPSLFPKKQRSACLPYVSESNKLHTPAYSRSCQCARGHWNSLLVIWMHLQVRGHAAGGAHFHTQQYERKRTSCRESQCSLICYIAGQWTQHVHIQLTFWRSSGQLASQLCFVSAARSLVWWAQVGR